MDEWARKYMVIAGAAPLKASEPKHEPPPKKTEPVAEAVPEAPVPIAAEEPPKKAPRKRTVKKELNDAAEKPKKLPVKRAAIKRKSAVRKAADS